jgi:hypothetical protein
VVQRLSGRVGKGAPIAATSKDSAALMYRSVVEFDA